MKNFAYIVLGAAFGIILTKSEVISWFRITKMFNFEELHMYLIIGSAIAVGIISVQIIKRVKIKSSSGDEINFQGKPLNKGTVVGGILFGIGWAITGACPGPIFAQIGSGEFAAISTLFGAVCGALTFNMVKNKLP